MKPIILLVLCFALLPSAEISGDIQEARWTWLIQQGLVKGSGQSKSYRSGYTDAIKWWLDTVKDGPGDYYWSLILTKDRDRQQGYFDGFTMREQVLIREVALSINIDPNRVVYLCNGKYLISSQSFEGHK